MRFLLDTNIISAHLKGNQRIFNRFVQHSGGLSTSAVCAGELYSWMGRRNTRAAYRAGLDDVLRDLILLPVDQDVARKYGEVRAALLDEGRPTPEIDLLIGCTALVHDLTLVTHNAVDFAQIPGLRIEDWLV